MSEVGEPDVSDTHFTDYIATRWCVPRGLEVHLQSNSARRSRNTLKRTKMNGVQL